MQSWLHMLFEGRVAFVLIYFKSVYCFLKWVYVRVTFVSLKLHL
jgi:hypothetical protein